MVVHHDNVRYDGEVKRILIRLAMFAGISRKPQAMS